MPILARSKILLVKLETAYATDAAPTEGANAILATQIRLMGMEGQDISRELETPWLGAQPTIPADLHAKLSFRVELEPSGTVATAPAWGPLLRACAFAQTISVGTSVTYSRVSTGHESVTIHFWMGGTRYVLKGARGNVTIRVDASGIPYLEFEFTGLFAAPSEQTRPTPDLTNFNAPRVASTANTPVFTLDGTTMVLRSFSLNAGNTIEPRFLIRSEGILITDIQETVEMQVEAVPLTTLDPYALALAGTPVPLVLTHGTGAGRIATLAAPRLQFQRPQGLTEAQGIAEWPLRAVPLPATGNDQLTLTLT